MTSIGQGPPRERRLTVSQLYRQRTHVDVTFNESARIYQLLASHPAFDAVLARLHQSHSMGDTVLVRFAAEDDATIEAVR